MFSLADMYVQNNNAIVFQMQIFTLSLEIQAKASYYYLRMAEMRGTWPGDLKFGDFTFMGLDLATLSSMILHSVLLCLISQTTERHLTPFSPAHVGDVQ